MRTYFFILLVSLSMLLCSQEDSTKSVLIVPFNSDVYYNAVSEKLCTESELSYHQLVNVLRIDLDSIITAAVSKKYQTNSFLNSFTSESNIIASDFYNSVNYKHKTAPDFDYKKYGHLQKSRVAIKKKKDKKIKRGISNGQIASDVVDSFDKYLHADFKSHEVLNKILEEYNCKGIIFISQLEIMSDYSVTDPDAQKGYDVYFKVHYNLFTQNGKHFYGSVAIVKTHLNEVSLEKIRDKFFPDLAEIIANKIVF